MLEKFILSNLDEKELLRTLSINGKVSFNTHIFNSYNLANEAMLRNGTTLIGRKIDVFEEDCTIYNLLDKVSYFKGSNFNDSKAIARQLNTARMLCRGNEDSKLNEVFKDGEFPDKNKAIYELYKLYKTELKNNNLYDSIDLINYVINNKLSIDGEFISFKQDNLMPLEEELIKTVSLNNFKVLDLIDYSGNNYKSLNKCTYDNSYGSINEIENIVAYICKNNIRYDDVLIVLNDNSYFRQLYDYANLYKIPMSFKMGYPISFSYPFHLYNLLVKWDKGYNAYNPLVDIFNAVEFNSDLFWSNVSNELLNERTKKEILKEVGSLRLSTVTSNKVIEDYKSTFKESSLICDAVVKTAEEFKKGYLYLLKTYSVIRDLNPNVDEAGLNIISKTIEQYISSIANSNPIDILDEISTKVICRQSSSSKTICVCNLKDALSINRKHVFITGLSAKTFPGSPKENYLLLDSDLKRFNEDDIAPFSDKIINDKKQLLMDVIEFENSFDSNIHLSYAGYSLTDLKVENPSSTLFEIYKKEKGNDVTIDDLNKEIGNQHHYFNEDISTNTKIGEKYLEGIDVVSNIQYDNEVKPFNLTWQISPSAADVYYECPKRFYLRYILGIDEPEEDDPFRLFPGGSVGTLVHKCMEDYGHNPNWTIDDFMNNVNNLFDDYLKKRITVHDKGLTKDKSDYLEMARNGFNNDPKNKTIIGSEYKLKNIEHESGLKFGGTVDRIEKLDTGNHVIVDYKTYSDIKNEANDIKTCFQVVLYAYLLEKTGKKVDYCEYRYLRNVRTIKTEYNDNIKEQLNSRINELKKALDTGDFALAEDEKSCKYCAYSEICGKYNKQELQVESEEVAG